MFTQFSIVEKAYAESFGATVELWGCISGRTSVGITVPMILQRKDEAIIREIQITDKEILKNHTKWVYVMADLDGLVYTNGRSVDL